MHNVLYRILRVFSYSGILFIASYLKLQYGFNNYVCSFSLVALMAPFLGRALNMLDIISMCTFYAVLSCLFKGGFFIPFATTFGIPTLIATIVLSNKHKAFDSAVHNELSDIIFKVGFPILAIITFIMHPIAGNAALYSCFWLIPMIMYCIEKLHRSSLYTQVITSTFLAHAAGSLIYLFKFPITSEQWIALIPIVIVERMLLSSALIGLITGENYVHNAIKKIKQLYAL